MILAALILAASIGTPADCLAVDAEWVTAGDVARLIPTYAASDPGLRLMRAPFPGARRLVTAASLPPALSAAPPPGLPDPTLSFCVERRLQSLSRSAFDQAIAQALEAALLPGNVAFEVLDFDRSRLPSGRLEFSVQSLPPPIIGRMGDAVLWRGRLYYAEARSMPVWARVRLTAESVVCASARDVARGEELKPEDCVAGRRQFAPFGVSPVDNPSSLEKMIAVRRLKAGEILFSSMIAAKPDVEAGRPVEVRVVSGGAQLRLQGKATANGKRGDSVSVTNTANGKRMEGRVVGEGSVEVRLK
jgi:flagella basal body P-ring formation protein FlgA